MTTLRNHSAVGADLPATAPAATRHAAPGWRDPRLIAGVVIVAVCVLVGSRVLAGADDTIAVWGVRHDVARGAVIGPDDVMPVRVHFTGHAADAYLPAAAGVSPGSTAAHDLVAGELLPRSAVSHDGGADLVEVPLSVAPDDLPASIRRGATVDVWVTPTVPATGAERVRARLVLAGVEVVDVPAGGDSLAPRTTQQVIVGVDEAGADDLSDALGQLADGRVVLVRRERP